jgi:tetratricopeptide (TPR) repeat protein
MRRSVGLVLALASALPTGAAAQDAPAAPAAVDVEALARRASDLYRAEQYTEAVQVYLQAWQAAPAAALLYNVAHIYDRKLAERELAIDFYRRYITSPDADPAAVARATERIQTLKQQQAEAAAAAAAKPPPVVTAPPPDPAPAVVAQPAESPPSRRRTVGWILAGGGVALLAGGGALGYVARTDADAYADSTDLDEKRDYRDGGRSKALAADVMMGVGLAAGAAGAFLLLTGGDDAAPVAVGAGPGFLVVGGEL